MPHNNPTDPALSPGQIARLAATGRTFDDLAAEYGEEVAIQVGIAREPGHPRIDGGRDRRDAPGPRSHADAAPAPRQTESATQSRCQYQARR